MKLAEITKKTINGKTFYLKPFGAFTSSRIFGDLANTVSPVVGGLAPLLTGDAGDKAVEYLAESLGNLDGEKVEKLVYKLIVEYHNVTYAGEETNNRNIPLTKDIIDELFCCEMFDLLALCVEVVKLNYGNFFKKLLTQSGDLIGNTEEMTKE